MMSGEIHTSAVQRVVTCYLNDYFLQVLMFAIFCGLAQERKNLYVQTTIL